MIEIANDFIVVKTTEIFLVPVSILLSALGVAQTEGLKTGISVLALILTGLWSVCLSMPIGHAQTLLYAHVS